MPALVPGAGWPYNVIAAGSEEVRAWPWLVSGAAVGLPVVLLGPLAQTMMGSYGNRC